MARKEVGAPPFLLPKCSQILQGVDARGQDGLGGGPFVVLEEGTARDVRVLDGEGADPAGGELAAGGIDGVAVVGGDDRGVDAEVLAGGESEGEEAGGGAEVEDLVAVEEAELGEGFLHLVDGAGAVEELEGIGRLGEGVAGDEREESNGLAGAGGHLEEAVSSGI